MLYSWQLPEWPNFTYELNNAEELWTNFSVRYGEISGLMQGLSSEERQQLQIRSMVAEAIKTSSIEGEYFSREDVYSSIVKNLGLSSKYTSKNEKAQGAAELMILVHQTYHKPLSKTTLFDWHKTLMKGYHNVGKGQWRKGKEPMQVVSGRIGKETIHFEAPPSTHVAKEMAQFIAWFNQTTQSKTTAMNPLIRAGIAHIYFETIHPFEDGNGRIGRAIVEKALSQRIGGAVMFSLSKEIEKNKKAYYTALMEAQHTLDLSNWLNYFMQLIAEAQKDIVKETQFTLKKTRFFDKHRDKLNDRQVKVTKKMLEAGPEGFKGGMSASKYISITKSSKATATRDLQKLYEEGIFSKQGGGRSIRYDLNLT